MNSRQEINRQILNILLGLNENISDQRFNQLILNYLSKKDNNNELSFYEESSVTLARLVETIGDEE